MIVDDRIIWPPEIKTNIPANSQGGYDFIILLPPAKNERMGKGPVPEGGARLPTC